MKTQFYFAGILILSLLISCNSDNKNQPDTTIVIPEKESFHAVVKENTEAVSLKTMKDLESYDQNTGQYVFSGNQKNIKNITPGTVVLFEGHSLARVTGVTSQDGKTIVTTEFAALTDYYQEADISYTAQINWDEASMASTKIITGEPVVALASAPVYGLTPATAVTSIAAQNSGPKIKIEREVQGWKIGFELNPQADQKLKIKLSAKKGRVCSITAEGFISSFESTSELVIREGETQNFTYSNNGLEGELELKFAAVGLGSEVAFLEIPATLERTILVNGIIPVTLRLKANLKIFPEVGVEESSQANMKLTYNSNSGFTYQQGRLIPQGGVSSDEAEQTGDSNTAATAVAGMGVGIEFPRFEVGILGQTIVPYLLLNTHTSSFLNTGIMDNNRCHMATLKYTGKAGVTLSFLGIASIANEYQLFEKEKKWKTPDSICAD